MLFCKNCSNFVQIKKPNTIDIDEMDLNPQSFIDTFLQVEHYKTENVISIDKLYKIQFPFSQVEKIKDMKNHLAEFNRIHRTSISNELFLEKLKTYYEQITKMMDMQIVHCFVCTTCNSQFVIEPGTVVEVVNYEHTVTVSDETPEIRKHDQTLMRTKDFICPNPKCINNTKSTEKVLKEKEAVMYTPANSHGIVYICCQCNKKWGTG